jgi:hypothetical protein
MVEGQEGINHAAVHSPEKHPGGNKTDHMKKLPPSRPCIIQGSWRKPKIIGKYADIVILEKNLFVVAPRDIVDVKVMATMMGVKFTHRDGL